MALADLHQFTTIKGLTLPEGLIDVFASVTCKRGMLTGGVKPILKNVKVEAADDKLGDKIKAVLADVAVNILSDRVPGRNAVATIIPIHGDLQAPERAARADHPRGLAQRLRRGLVGEPHQRPAAGRRRRHPAPGAAGAEQESQAAVEASAQRSGSANMRRIIWLTAVAAAACHAHQVPGQADDMESPPKEKAGLVGAAGTDDAGRHARSGSR